MEKASFKNFKYALSNLSQSGYKEVIVTFDFNEHKVHQCVFVKEVEGKSDNYYIAEAKKQIKERIESGAINKSATRQIKHSSGSKRFLKPVTVTLSCVLAAGALGTGGYFLGSYLNGGNGGGGDVTTDHTVVLYGGDGVFENHKTYLIFNNVKDKTPLGDIKGYALPTYEDYDFLKWNGPIEDQPYGTSFKITEDIVLTASFFEGIKYIKAQAVNSINVELKYLLDNYEIEDPVVKKMLDDIYEKTRKFIDNIEESTEPAVIDDARNTISGLKECAIETLDTVASTASISTEVAKEIEETYDKALNSLVKEKSTAKRAALVKFNSGYIKAVSEVTDTTIVDKTYDELTKMLSDYDEETDSLNIRLLGHFAKGVIAGSAYFTNSEQIDVIKQLPEWFFKLKEVGLIEDDTDTIDWVGDFFNYYYYASSRYNYHDPQMNTYARFIKMSADDAINALFDYLSTSNLKPFAIFTLNDAMIKSLANVEFYYGLPDYDDFNGAVYKGNPNYSAYSLLSSNLANYLTKEIMDDTIPSELREAGKLMLNKILACFENVMKAFSIWQVGFDWLFCHQNDGIIYQVARYCDLASYDDGSSVLLDNYVTLTEKAIEIAKKPILESKISYDSLCALGATLMGEATYYGTLNKLGTEFFNPISSFFDLIIPVSVDSGLVLTEGNLISTVLNLFNTNTTTENGESKNSAYYSLLVSTLYGLFASENYAYKSCNVSELSKAKAMVIRNIDRILGFLATNKGALLKIGYEKPTIVPKIGETMQYIFVDKWEEVLSIFGTNIDEKFAVSHDLFKSVFNLLTDPLTGREGAKILDGSDLQFEAYFDTIASFFSIVPKLQTLEKFNIAYNGLVVNCVYGCFVRNFKKATELKEAFIANFVNKVEKDMSEDELMALINEVQAILEEIIYDY